MGKVVFTKNYTRDTSLIIQQIWFEVIGRGLSDNFGIAMPKIIMGLDFINNGTVEVWENTNYIKKLVGEIIKLATNQPRKISHFLIRYEKGLKGLSLIWEKGYLTGRKRILWLIKQIRQKMFSDAMAMYLAEDKRTPPKVKAIAQRLRAHDQFFAANDIVLRNSLKRLWPALAPFTQYIKADEIKGPLPTRAELKDRYAHYIATSDGYCNSETLASFAKRHPDYIFKEQKIKSTSLQTIKGQVAHKGKARGIVRIIRNVKEMSRVKIGDILVMPMTTAQFSLAIHRAAGIVTEEGGMLCHAAVISRELKKPCVIGTKIATRVFKDGDMVEVDATKGVVRKIK